RVLRDVQDIAGALDVGAEQRRRIAQPAAGVHDAVVEVVDAGHRGAQGVVVPDVAVEAVDVEVVDADGVGAGADHDPHVVPVGDQLAGDVRAEEPVGADDQLAHLPPPYFVIHSSASGASVPSAAALRHHLTAADTNRSGL